MSLLSKIKLIFAPKCPVCGSPCSAVKEDFIDGDIIVRSVKTYKCTVQDCQASFLPYKEEMKITKALRSKYDDKSNKS